MVNLGMRFKMKSERIRHLAGQPSRLVVDQNRVPKQDARLCLVTKCGTLLDPRAVRAKLHNNK